MWVTLFSAAVILFSADWIKVLKRWTSPLFVRLFLPLIFSSYCVISDFSWIKWIITWLQFGALFILYWLSAHIQGFRGQFIVVCAITISLTAYIPTLFFKFTEKPFRLFKPPYWSSLYIWLILSIFLVIPYA